MDIDLIRKFRENLRIFERELDIQNNSGCCCGVTLTQCHTLMELSKKDNISLNQLTEKLSLDKSTVSRIVEGLVKNDLVDRTIPNENRRTTIISLTKQGIAVCKQINEGNDEYFIKVLSTLPEEELVVFLKSFENVAYEMKTLNDKGIECET